MGLLWLLALPLVALVIYGFRPIDRIRLAHIPGPSQIWLLGNLPGFAKYGDFEFFNQLRKQYGNVFKVWALGNNVVVTTPQLCRQVLLHNANRWPMPNLFKGKYKSYEDATILWMEGEQARTIRSAWHPLFYSGSLEGFTGLMHQAADTAVQRLAAAAKSKDAIDATDVMSNMTLQVIAAAAVGIDVSNPDAVLKDFGGSPYTSAQLVLDIRTAFRTMLNQDCPYTQLNTLVPFAVPLWRQLANAFPSENHAAAIDFRNRLFTYVEWLIDDHSRAVADQEDTIKAFKPTSDAVKSKGVAPGSFIDILVRTRYRSTGTALSDAEIVNQVYGMLLGGLETTSNALSFAVYLLAQHPDKADKMIAEIHNHPDKTPSYSSLTEGFPYIEAVIREAMRLYPPGSFVARTADKDMDLGGYKVPKGTRLIGALYAMNHNESVWPNAEAFMPERHLSDDAEGAPTQPHAWLGFGDGQRSCVGKRLAMLEAKLALFHLFRKLSYRLTPGQVPLKLMATIALAPADGVWVTVHERDDPPAAAAPAPGLTIPADS